MNEITRSKLIQIWFMIVCVVIAAGVTLGTRVTAGTGAMLFLLCLVPPTIVLILWPGVQAPTAAEVLHEADTRP
jgi:hypothetical protein